MFTSVQDVYELTERVIRLCQEQGNQEVANQLDRALSLGSSPLEILGAIRTTFTQNTDVLARMIGQNTVINVVAYVDKAYGR